MIILLRISELLGNGQTEHGDVKRWTWNNSYISGNNSPAVFQNPISLKTQLETAGLFQESLNPWQQDKQEHKAIESV